MLNLKKKSLNWTLKHIEKHGDTDIFPIPFEYKAIRFEWDNGMCDYLQNVNVSDWNVRTFRKTLTPKHRYGFRVATQLDPLDCLIFTSLVYEIGEDIENYRIDKAEKVALSNRFLPSDDGNMYDTEFGWKEFQQRSEELLNTIIDELWGDGYVVVADIADFYPRLYSHPLENALKECTNKNNHVKNIMRMLNGWNYSVSYGIPVGPSATRLLAELAIDDVDRALISEGVKHCRFVDDFRIFCKSEKEAYEHLSLLAKILFENHGLTLQQHKTKILSVDDFREQYLVSDDKKTLNNLSQKFIDILDELGVDSYAAIVHGDIPDEVQKEIDELNLVDILREQVVNNEIDSKLVAFVLHRLGKMDNSEALDVCIGNIDKLYTVFKSIFIYINDLKVLSSEEKSKYGAKILSLLNDSIVGHLEYHLDWVFSLFASDNEWNNKDQFVKMYNKYQDEYSRRQLILALGKSKASYWFKSQKRNISRFSDWERRSFIAAVTCLPGDEAKHWYKSIKASCDELEDCVFKWARSEF